MKFTNVKQLIIKFMGGGIINFPTRFLRWVKINGDSEDDGSDDGDGGDSGGGGIDKFYLKLNRENLHLDDMYYTDFDSTIGHDLDFFFEDTDTNLVSKIIENIKEQINNIPEDLTKPNIYTNYQFTYTSNETGLVGGYSNGVYPIFNILYSNDGKPIIGIGSTNYAGQSIGSFQYLFFRQGEDGKFYYDQDIYS